MWGIGEPPTMRSTTGNPVAIEEVMCVGENSPAQYEIIVAGQPGRVLDEAVTGFEVAVGATGRLRLTGPIVDQAALIGILSRLRDLRYEVLEVHQVS